MERDSLIEAGPTYTYLRGLLMIPVGGLFLLVGAGDLEWGPFGNVWVLWTGVAAMVAAFVFANRHYRTSYGKVTLDRAQQMKDLFWTLGGAVLLVAAATLDARLDLPVNGYVVAYAVVMLGYSYAVIGMKLHHAIIWGGLLVAGLLPMWGEIGNEVAYGLLPMGLATIASGLFDHLRLVARFGSPGRVSVGNGNVGA